MCGKCFLAAEPCLGACQWRTPSDGGLSEGIACCLEGKSSLLRSSMGLEDLLHTMGTEEPCLPAGCRGIRGIPGVLGRPCRRAPARRARWSGPGGAVAASGAPPQLLSAAGAAASSLQAAVAQGARGLPAPLPIFPPLCHTTSHVEACPIPGLPAAAAANLLTTRSARCHILPCACRRRGAAGLPRPSCAGSHGGRLLQALPHLRRRGLAAAPGPHPRLHSYGAQPGVQGANGQTGGRAGGEQL